MSELRLCSLKKIIFPRLELMGAVIGARVTKYVLQTLNCIISRTFHRTDSTTMLHWIKGDFYKWKPFVCNQVTEIQDKIEHLSKNYCPGEENPADLLTMAKSLLD
ncbi:hypothetical protein AVEN_68825-1 [Araneus ventricosus]|uniref:Uncharacterized protein n=1 Tax=Araneus ventricosus TaxID=182803 RepID=A0A4Y2C5E0_ARAVE|nr:hypothetical protein AVEN_68825-1 [Araneus ventricosus]